MESDAPTDLEMELRRNLTPCKCGHVWLDHALEGNCYTCACPEFRESY